MKADVEKQIEDEVASQGVDAIASCVPETDVKLSCIVEGSDPSTGESGKAAWEATIDPDTGEFAAHSVGP